MSATRGPAVALWLVGAVSGALAHSPSPSPSPPPPPSPSAEELDLLAVSLRPEGRAELSRNLGALADLPIYELEAELDLDRARVDGRLRLLYRNPGAVPLRDLVLRLYPMKKGLRVGTTLSVAQVQVDGVRARVHASGSLVEVQLPTALLPGQRTALTLAFHGKLQRLKSGEDDLVSSSLAALAPGTGAQKAAEGYGTFAVSDLGATLINWYPQLAARPRGAWDRAEPGLLGDDARADVGSALVTLTVPKGFKVVGPGSALGQHATAKGKEQASFALAGLRGSMGLSVAKEPDSATGEAAGVKVVASSFQGPEGAQALVECGREALTELSRRFGPYPWTQLVLAETPLVGGAGGVELPGLSFISTAVARARGSGGATGGLFDFTCHHEVAHQWWQALVGSDPRGAPWVDEALAQFSAVLVAEAAAGSQLGARAGEHALAQNVALNYQGMRMMGQPDGKVSKATTAYRSPLAYTGLVYGKAPFLFVRARALVGDQKLDEILRAYRGRFAFREAQAAEFTKVATEKDPAHAAQLKALAQRYLFEAHGDEDLPKLDPTSLAGMMGADLAGMDGLAGLLGGGSGPGLQGLQGLLKQLDPNARKSGPHAATRGGRGHFPQGVTGGAGGGAAGTPGLAPHDQDELRRALQQLDKLVPGLRQMLEQGMSGMATDSDAPDADAPED